MRKKREYSHEDMERLGEEINALRMRARQVDHDISNGVITHEQWEAAAHELFDRKKEIMEILSDVDRYKRALREEVRKEHELLQKAEDRIAVLEAKAKGNNN